MQFKNIFPMTLMLAISSVFAGGFVTNTNQSAHYVRGIARELYRYGCCYTILPGGFYERRISPWKQQQSFISRRSIKVRISPFLENGEKNYDGMFLNLVCRVDFLVYNTGDLANSGGFYLVGGEGLHDLRSLPSFEAPLATLPVLLASRCGPLFL
jgi:hypothetical protein